MKEVEAEELSRQQAEEELKLLWSLFAFDTAEYTDSEQKKNCTEDEGKLLLFQRTSLGQDFEQTNKKFSKSVR